MRECVVDASVVLDWFSEPPSGAPSAVLRLRHEFEQGDLEVVAPPLIHLEILNVAGRRWGWDAEDLQELGEVLVGLAFALTEPELPVVAKWVASGLTAYDAAYVALAEALAVPLVTRDAAILSTAVGIAEEPV